ncbi:MAG: DUF1751 domain-containing protein [Armatimonadota bacterium]|nr:DUF1751 domain-containing protein [Armatimonadota bacterium]MDR7448964.1 DUF1751 domain-containing protein [Armatimonadota bacterium]MDR7460381.1 DUF1751 domain-containing protein [Armatimonadota bacterium]MDR7480533.1 DUF1751 domain-containing protein [Armatimonadota bacterium]MDR7489156.1 DUF1751 domain-containing protein [Armatimonadota bacterium]
MTARSSSFLAGLPGGVPVTWAILLANAATFLLAFVGAGGPLDALVFHTWEALPRPWTLLTYALVGAGHPLWLLVGLYVFWMFAGSLERSWGRVRYLTFLAMATAAPAAALGLGAALLGRGVGLAGLWLPLAGTIVAWGALRPYEQALLFFVLPVQFRWIAVGATALVFFSFPFPLGLFALAGPGVAWASATGRVDPATWRVGWSRGGRGRRAIRRDGPTLSPLAWYRRWQTKRRFRRLVRQVDLEDRH